MKKKTITLIALITIGALLLTLVANMCLSFIGKQIYPLKYEEYVEKYSLQYNVPASMVYAVIKTESDFDPNALSSAGAMGLMQMMPDTFLWLTSEEHLGEALSVEKVYDPETGIRYGVYYLRYLYEKFPNWDTVAAAYNAGEGNVARWLESAEYSNGDGTLKNIPFKETKTYTRRISLAKKFYEYTYNK